MYINYDEKSNTYEFKNCSNPNDISCIISYLEKRHEDPEIKYITSELGENLIKTKLKGDIFVNCKKIETVIEGEDKSNEAEMFVKLAKYSEENNENLKYKKHGGKGFISILRLGWDIAVEKISESKYKVVASK